MRSGIERAEDGAPGVTRRLVRLFVLLGVVAAVYLVLSLFDHAARADTGLSDQVGAAKPGQAAAAHVRKPASELKSKARVQTARVRAPKRTHSAKTVTRDVKAVGTRHAPKAHPAETIRQVQASVPKVRPAETARRVQASVPKVRAADTVRRVQASVPKVRPAETIRRVQNSMSKVRPAETVRQARRTETVRASVSTGRQLTSRVVRDAAPTTVQTVVGQKPPTCTTTGSELLGSPTSARRGQPASAASAPVAPPAAPAQPRKSPSPDPKTGQVRDSGGVHVPMMGTVSSSWRPEGAAVGRALAVDLVARGRTVRFAGPPS